MNHPPSSKVRTAPTAPCGATFVLTSAQQLPLMGQLTRALHLRLREHQVGDGPWQVWELESLTASAK